MLQFSSFTQFQAELENIHQRDLFAFMNLTTQKVSLNHPNANIIPTKFSYSDGKNSLMTKLEIYYDVIIDGKINKYLYTSHRANDFSCSNIDHKKLD